MSTKQLSALFAMTLAACPAPDDGETDGPATAATEAGTDANTGTGSSPTTGTTTDPGGTTGTPGGSLCDAPHSFSDPGNTEYFQWAIDGKEYVSLPPPGGAYFFNSYLSVALYSSDLASSMGFGSINSFPDGVAAGTYLCSGTDGVFVNGGPLGLANAQAPTSSCVITLDQDVTDGGSIVGTLSARLVDLSGTVTACVDGRFALTDAAP